MANALPLGHRKLVNPPPYPGGGTLGDLLDTSISLKFTCILLQNHPEEKAEYLLAGKRQKIAEKQLPSVCKPMHILLQKPQFHALITNFCVINERKVQR